MNHLLANFLDQQISKRFALADVTFGGGRNWDMQINDPRALLKIAAQGSLGFGEGYVEGLWDTPHLDQLIHKIYTSPIGYNQRQLPNFVARARRTLVNRQDQNRSKRVGEQHYDIGNNFYQKMLDKRMVYTCAYWQNGAQTLEQAQEDKLDLVCRKLKLKPGMRVLDLGCGWGGLAQYMAENYDVSVTGIVIAKEQADWARQHCQNLDVEIFNDDYRNLPKDIEKFDRVVSIGLLEHIGPKNYSAFFKTIKERLRTPEDLVLIHSIVRQNKEAVDDPWFSRYIFPGGALPSPRHIMEATEGLFVQEDIHNIGADYDTTLMHWYANFVAHWDEFRADYPPNFFRMWEYYLLSSAGAFRARYHQLWQVVLSPAGVPGSYHSER